MLDPGSRILDPGCWILDLGSRILDPGSWIQDLGSWIHIAHDGDRGCLECVFRRRGKTLQNVKEEDLLVNDHLTENDKKNNHNPLLAGKRQSAG